jgi:hypothetical protein
MNQKDQASAFNGKLRGLKSLMQRYIEGHDLEKSKEPCRWYKGGGVSSTHTETRAFICNTVTRVEAQQFPRTQRWNGEQRNVRIRISNFWGGSLLEALKGQ